MDHGKGKFFSSEVAAPQKLAFGSQEAQYLAAMEAQLSSSSSVSFASASSSLAPSLSSSLVHDKHRHQHRQHGDEGGGEGGGSSVGGGLSVTSKGTTISAASSTSTRRQRQGAGRPQSQQSKEGGTPNSATFVSREIEQFARARSPELALGAQTLEATAVTAARRRVAEGFTGFDYA
jgi:hypothetical protein